MHERATADRVAGLLKERITFADELLDLGRFFFIAPAAYDEQAISKKWNDDAVLALTKYKERLQAIDAVNADNAKARGDELEDEAHDAATRAAEPQASAIACTIVDLTAGSIT